MSCEYLIQAICENGHLFEEGAWDFVPDRCPHCSAPWMWQCSWDVTNEYPPAEDMAEIIIPAIAQPPRGTPEEKPEGQE